MKKFIYASVLLVLSVTAAVFIYYSFRPVYVLEVSDAKWPDGHCEIGAHYSLKVGDKLIPSSSKGKFYWQVTVDGQEPGELLQSNDDNYWHRVPCGSKGIISFLYVGTKIGSGKIVKSFP